MTRTELVAVTLSRCELIRAGVSPQSPVVSAVATLEGVASAMEAYGASARAVVAALDSQGVDDRHAEVRRRVTAARARIREGVRPAGHRLNP